MIEKNEDRKMKKFEYLKYVLKINGRQEAQLKVKVKKAALAMGQI